MGKERTSLTLQQKLQVITWSEQGLSGQKIAERVAAQYGLTVDKSSINKMLN
jgi:CENP-B N-terminal DNA-binding domain